MVDSSSSPTELYIDRLFDGTLNDYDFFLHVETAGGYHSARSVTELLKLKAPCENQDLSITLIQNQDLSYGSGYHILENFVTTDQVLCKLEACEVRDSTCLELLDDPLVFYD